MAYFSSTHGKIIIGDDVMFGPGVVLVGGNHLVEDKYTKMIDILKGKDHDDGFLTIKNNVWIGANVVIMPNVTIETGCIIGANAVVTDSTVPYGIYGGVPAKLIKIRK
jgi:acetyltransferase-like isoleucine patch superfamily enzyme